MKRHSAILIFILLPFLSSQAFSSPALQFPQYGFQIEALESPIPANTSMQALIMFLPHTDGFSPNINIQLQAFQDPLEKYREISLTQFEQLEWKVIEEKFEEDRWVIEYTGDDLHCYAIAIQRNNLIYLVTGCSRESQWATVGEEIRKRVDSFKLTPE